jgi:hypothetical protein
MCCKFIFLDNVITEDVALVMKMFLFTGPHSNWHKETKSSKEAKG